MYNCLLVDVIEEQVMSKVRSKRIKEAVMDVVGQNFRPEFINRIDESVVFQPLQAEQIRDIAKIQLGALEQRLHERDLTLDISEDALDMLAASGFDPVYGARPLKRAIQKELENPLAQKILAGAYSPGDTIQVGVENNKLSFKH